MSPLKKIVILLAVLLVAALAGFSVYAWLQMTRYQQAFALAANEITSAKNALNSNTALYGTIVSVDAAARTIKISTIDQFREQEPTVREWDILPNAFIGQQEITSSASSSVSLVSPIAPVLESDPFSVLQAGARVKFQLTPDQGKQKIFYLVTGNPL